MQISASTGIQTSDIQPEANRLTKANNFAELSRAIHFIKDLYLHYNRLFRIGDAIKVRGHETCSLYTYIHVLHHYILALFSLNLHLATHSGFPVKRML
jgi:hypothetical protein